MNESVKAAAVQMVSGDNKAANLSVAAELVAQAVSQGAALVVLPENFAFMGRRQEDVLTAAEAVANGPAQTFLATAAARHGITLVGGSVPLWGPEAARVRSACLVYGPDGQLLARYDKRHLFDVTLTDGEGYRESSSFAAGDRTVVVETPVGRLGLSICYDLRFPEHYRELMAAGAEILLAPSAFTAATGAAHWAVLVRARAIENLCFMVAPNQGGMHVNGRSTHGESAVVSPWGEMLASCPVAGGAGVAVAPLRLSELASLRHRFPALTHRR